MQSTSDAWLLRAYAEHGQESAFAELTARYTNLVYSAALRQVDSPDQAAEVAQQVFIALARGAQALSRRLAADASLAGWLCRCARNLSLNLRRDEYRRASRERQAMAQHDATSEALPDWEQLRGVLDEAMAELSETDYEAVVLRFYQQQDLCMVGRALGVSDDAAQKRVSRAVERLRESLAKRGVAIGASALVALISAHAVQAAPAGLAVTLSAAAVQAGTHATATTVAVTAAAGTGAAGALTSAVAKTLAMTTLQKTLLVGVLTVAVGTGIYQLQHAAQRTEPTREPPQPQAALRAEAPAGPAARPASGELPPTVPISLASLLVPAEDDQWDKSAIFKAMPRGKQVFGGVQFQVDGVLQLQSHAAQEDNRTYRQSVVIPLSEATATAAGLQILQGGSNVATVHLLGATRFGGEGECSVAQLVWHYADGGTRTTDIRFQNHVRDWIRQPFESPTFLPQSSSKAVWHAPVPKRDGLWVRLYRFSYLNPEPGRVLQQLELASTMQEPNLFVAGLSLDPVLLGQRPDDAPNLEGPDPAEPVQLRLVVQTPEGAPIPQAKVRVQVEQAAGKSPERFEYVQSTDGAGIAQLNYPLPADLQRLEVAATHEEHAGRKMVWEPSAGDVIPAEYTLKLGPGLSLGGVVVDETEAPIAGARLEVARVYMGGEPMRSRGEQSEFARVSLTSDAQGHWQAKGLAADLLDRIRIHASHPAYVATNYFGGRTAGMEQALRAGTFKVVLSRGSWVMGRVLDDADRPIEGATVYAGKPSFSGTQQTKSGVGGAFTFQNLNAGEVQFSVLAKGRKPEVKLLEVTPGMPEIVFRLGPGQLLHGLVKAEAGQPVAGVRIALESKATGGVSDTYPMELTSGEDGRFEWDGAPEEPQNFCFLKKGYETKRGQALQPKEENVITLRKERKIQGRVLDATTERPITKFRVGMGRYSGQSSFYADYPGLKDCADANGQFSLSASEERSNWVKVEADDYAPQVEQLPEATNGVVQVVLRLKSSLGLRGVLVTAEGAPVAGGTVAAKSQQGPPTLSLRNNRLTDMSGQSKVATSGSDGQFVLPSPPETGTVFALGETGFGQASLQQVRESGRLVLQPFGRIEGVVTRNGQPVAGQEFVLTMRDLGLSFDFNAYKVTSDPEGRFSFERVPPGAVEVVRLVKSSPTSWTHSYGADVTVLPGQTAQVTLGDSGATLSGQVRFETPPAAGEPLSLSGMLRTKLPPVPADLSPEARSAYFQSPEWQAQLKHVKNFAFTIGADGSWTVDSIPPGDYTLSITASKPGSRPFGTPVAFGSAQVVVPEGVTPQTQLPVDEVVLRPPQTRSVTGP